MAKTSDMFQWKINKIFKDLPNVFGIADDILIVGYDADGRDYNRTLNEIMEVCHQENLKLNKSKFQLMCMKE